MDIRTKLTFVISGITIMLVGVITAIFFLAFDPLKKPPASMLEVYDIEVIEGESKAVSYVISNDNAVIHLESLDSAVASVIDKEVKGEKEGTTLVRITADFGKESISKTFQVTVTKRADQQVTYGYDVDCIKNCDYTNGALVVQNDEVVFGIDIFQNEQLLSSKLEIVFMATEGIKIQREFTRFILSPHINGIVSFYIPSLNYSFSLKLKKS